MRRLIGFLIASLLLGCNSDPSANTAARLNDLSETGSSSAIPVTQRLNTQPGRILTNSARIVWEGVPEPDGQRMMLSAGNEFRQSIDEAVVRNGRVEFEFWGNMRAFAEQHCVRIEREEEYDRHRRASLNGEESTSTGYGAILFKDPRWTRSKELVWAVADAEKETVDREARWEFAAKSLAANPFFDGEQCWPVDSPAVFPVNACSPGEERTFALNACTTGFLSCYAATKAAQESPVGALGGLVVSQICVAGFSDYYGVPFNAGTALINFASDVGESALEEAFQKARGGDMSAIDALRGGIGFGLVAGAFNSCLNSTASACSAKYQRLKRNAVEFHGICEREVAFFNGGLASTEKYVRLENARQELKNALAEELQDPSICN